MSFLEANICSRLEVVLLKYNLTINLMEFLLTFSAMRCGILLACSALCNLNQKVTVQLLINLTL